MDDIGNLIYIAFLLIYVVSRLIGRKKPVTRQERPQKKGSNQEPVKTEKRPSFEELLREFTEQATGMPSETNQKKEREPEQKPLVEDEQYDQYQEAVASAKKLKTIDEQVDLNEPLESMMREKAYAIEEEKEAITGDLLDTLRNPNDARRAVILKEILDTKF